MVTLKRSWLTVTPCLSPGCGRESRTGLTPGNLITHLRKLEDARYVQMEKTGSGV